MAKSMLDIMKGRLPEGLTIKSVKENNSQYHIIFEYEGETAKADLSKTCTPGCHNSVADHTIITAMSSIMFNRGDFAEAKKWLDKLIDKE